MDPLQTIYSILSIGGLIVTGLGWLIRHETTSRSLQVEERIKHLEKDFSEHKVDMQRAHDQIWEKISSVNNQLVRIIESCAKIEGFLFGESKKGD